MSLMSGRCYCGAVSFTVSEPSLWCAHCHCSICQRTHGSGLVTWVGCASTSVELKDDDGKLKWYESSPGARRGRCSECGTPLFFRSDNWPGELHITMTSFDSPVDRQPAGHAFYATHVNWIELADKLPRKD